MKAFAAPPILTRLIANLAAIIAVCVIFAAGATKAGVAAQTADSAPTYYAAKPD